MYGYDSATELLIDALCDLTDDEATEVAHYLIDMEDSKIDGVRRLSSIIKAHKSNHESPSFPTLSEVFFEASDEALEQLLDRAQRARDLQESLKNGD
jgi:hypothetical protein